jgi:hypothetical protein
MQGINPATRHTWATKATRVATFRDEYKKVELGPSYPSAVFHAKTSTGSSWVARTLSQCHPWSIVGCHPTQRSSKLLSLWDPINPVWASTQLNTCCNRAQPTRSLIDLGGATTSKLQIWKYTTLNLPLRYSSLSPSCPTQSHIKLQIRSLT